MVIKLVERQRPHYSVTTLVRSDIRAILKALRLFIWPRRQFCTIIKVYFMYTSQVSSFKIYHETVVK